MLRPRRGNGSGELIEGWYTRARRGSVVAIIQLVPPGQRDLSSREAVERFVELAGDIPDADEVEVRYTLGDSEASITFLLQHDDLKTLNAASRTLQHHLREYDKAYYIRDDQWGALPEMRFHLKPGAEKLGVTLGDVSSQVRQAFYGEEVQRLPREHGDVRVMVRYPKAARGTLASFEDFRIRTPDGRLIPALVGRRGRGGAGHSADYSAQWRARGDGECDGGARIAERDQCGCGGRLSPRRCADSTPDCAY